MSRIRRYKNLLIPAAAVLVWGLLGFFFDFYFDLNDDSVMKDILSGRYSGVPEGRAVQTLYPLGALIAGLYRVLPGDVYGAVLLALQALAGALCTAALTRRAWPDSCGEESPAGVRQGEKRYVPAGIAEAVCAGLLFIVPLFRYLVFVQYTMTVAMLMAAAGALMSSADYGEEKGAVVRKCLLPAAVFAAAYLLRTEMALLLLPLAGTGLILRLVRQGRFGNARRKTAREAALVIALVAAVILAGEGADRLALSSPEWRSFRTFFDARTELYDFVGCPSEYMAFEGNEEFYSGIGMDREEVLLLENYNFALDDNLDAGKMSAAAAHAAGNKKEALSLGGELRRAFWEYRHSLAGGADAAFAVLTAAAYLVFLAAAGGSAAGRFCQAAALFAVRTGLWMFILYRGRAPERITFGLWITELMVLFALTAAEPPGEKTWRRPAAVAVTGVILLLILPGRVRETTAEYGSREETNRARTAYEAYCDAHPEGFYITDVYSTVDFSEKMFVPGGGEELMPSNRDLAGGWLAFSPLQKKKLDALGLPGSLSEALLAGNDVYFVVESGGDVSFLPGEPVLTDTIGEFFDVYSCRPEKQ
ncbi:MAG: hypothetical protein II759_04585 [Lachnospiraceae bacterium]|nr:hypothetical protein [Lachnospiraceae bacterium]